MKESELAEMLGGVARLKLLRARGLPEQTSITARVGAENRSEVIATESDHDYLLRVVAWLRAQQTHDAFLQAQAVPNAAAMRAAIADHIDGFLNGSLPNIDREIASAVMTALRQATAGEVPDLFAPLPRRRGEKVEGLALRACIQAGGAYIVYCLAHSSLRWVDRSPVKTVVERFGVSRETAARWKGRVSPNHLEELKQLPAPGERRTKRFRELRAAMRSAGAQYARFGGQSQDAQKVRLGRAVGKADEQPATDWVAAELRAIQARESAFVPEFQRAAQLGSATAQKWLSDRGHGW